MNPTKNKITFVYESSDNNAIPAPKKKNPIIKLTDANNNTYDNFSSILSIISSWSSD
ncbi:hypothetical protein Q604_UNBC18677G0001 [human gut metagenome]|uniref:Uncharacterized protein n=1 Tax=human gut metagenome TaxID=408170 RepID=W1WLV8_9ZZZZ